MTMAALLQDLAFALRLLRKNPGFTAAAVLTLALGIGANTAILSVADAALFRSPTVEDPERLVSLFTTCRRGQPRCSSSYPDYLDYRERGTSFTDLAAYTRTTVNLGDEAGSRLLQAQPTTSNFFSVLGVEAFLGRTLAAEDEKGSGGSPVAVLSHHLWRRHFAADQAILGRTLRLNGNHFTVVGVLPESFRGLHLDAAADLYVPLVNISTLMPGFDPAYFENRNARWIRHLVGRLADGVTVAEARAQMMVISDQLAVEDPDARGPRAITVDALPGHILPTGHGRDIQHFIILLVGVVAAALLLAAANLANLLLARAWHRRREIGVRIALGAGRSQLIRQLMTESFLLATLGGLAGLLVSQWTLELLGRFELPGGVSIGGLEIGLDQRMLATAMALSLFTGLLFGLVPAWQAARHNVSAALKGETTSGAGPGTLRGGLIAVQVALCLMLLVGAALFLRTLQNSLHFNPGFQTEDVALATFDLSLLRYTPERGLLFVNELTRSAKALPSVEAAAVTTLVPFHRGGFRGVFGQVEGYTPAPDEEVRIDFVGVGTEFFRVLGIPMRSGRALTHQDGANAPPAIVINQEMARRFWPGGEPVGGRVSFLDRTFEVVGVAADVKWQQLTESPTPFCFLPMAQAADLTNSGELTLAVKTKTPAAQILPELRALAQHLDPDLSLATLTTLEEQLGRRRMPQRMGAILLSAFGLLALLLAALGIYGVVAYTVVQKTRDIGIRMALGARRPQVMSLVLRGIAGPVTVGLGCGLAVTVVAIRAAESFFFGVHSQEPITLAGIGLLLAAIAIAASWYPAWGATRISPIDALHQD